MSHSLRLKRPGIPENPPVQRNVGIRASKSLRKSNVDNGSKIKVILRCRGNNGLKQNSSARDSLEPFEGETEAGILLKSNNKFYRFDHVFDQNTTQEQVYNKVADPVLHEVLKGYSCTIFAYGQTGTGKTYTMEGDLGEADNLQGRNAGIIPRTIRKLFEAIKSKDAKNHVMVSMLELYNEELRDLLCGSEEHKPLNIFEEKEGTGVKVQNIKEIPITTAENGLNVMKEGVRRRMTAATNTNDKSSRSHSIFTITVYLHELATNGEHIYRVGKLNLVDLAGSENSRSSGSENIRAREAASINRSLLTLGRVINSLVDKTPHIPYRESKLTRLLKDSIGGRTKTYIIATVSPETQTSEELRSTLDYASHASTISNQPQANSPIHQERQVDKLVKMLESTHDELRITQERFGVYVPKKTFDGMKNEMQSLKEQAIAKDIIIQDYKNAEKHHKEQIKHAVDELNLKLKKMEDQVSIANREKEELKAQHQEKENKMEREAQLKQKKLEMDFELKEKNLMGSMIQEREKQQKELQTEKKKYDDLVQTMEQFRRELNKSNDTMWESMFLKARSNSNSYSQSSHQIREVTMNDTTSPSTTNISAPTTHPIIPTFALDTTNKKLSRTEPPNRLSNLNSSNKYSKKRPLEDSSYNLPRSKK